jgi:hypothetical protein
MTIKIESKKVRKNINCTADFIYKSNIIHNNQYNYSKAEYKGNRIHLTIICKKHGEFTMTPDRHLYNKDGCIQCKKTKKTQK